MTEFTIADSDGVDAFGEQAIEFLRDILDQEVALITDESSIQDFIDFTLQGEAYEAEKREIWRRIEEKYHVDCTGETNILAILRKVHAPKGHA